MQSTQARMESPVADGVTNVHAEVEMAAGRACDNPDCPARIHWSGQRGRPQLFCSAACRKRAISAAGRLEHQVDQLKGRLYESAVTYREVRALRAALSRVQWLLSSYPESTRRTRDPVRPADS